jgi:hypothetical protein
MAARRMMMEKLLCGNRTIDIPDQNLVSLFQVEVVTGI